jgi:hypothetical protein
MTPLLKIPTYQIQRQHSFTMLKLPSDRLYKYYNNLIAHTSPWSPESMKSALLKLALNEQLAKF